MAGFYTTEHEVYAECDIVGSAQIGSIVLRSWEIREFSRGESRLLHLTFPNRQLGYLEGLENPIDEMRHGFDSGLTPAEEFVSLASLFLRRRLRVGATVKVGGQPNYMKRKHKPYSQLVDRSENLQPLPEFFEKVALLCEEDQQSLILAARFYCQGLRMTTEDPELAYISHLCSLEALVNRFKVSLNHTDCIAPEILAGLLTIPDEGIREKTIKSLARVGRVAYVVRRMVETLVDDSFFIQNSDPNYWITRDNLPRLMRNIYSARSKTLHEGKPFPEDVMMSTFEGEELPFGISVRRGIMASYEADPFKNPNRIPLLHAFERLVNHILRRFIDSRANGAG